MAGRLGALLTTRATTPAGRRRASARAAAAASTRSKAAKAARPQAAKPRTRRAAAKASPARPGSRQKKRAPKRRPFWGRAAPKPAVPRARTRRLGSLRRKLVLVLAITVALAIGYFAWFRDSPLVAVDDVKVEGLGGGASNPAAAALVAAAKDMTTLDVDQGRLDEVASRFPEIASVSASASFPHSLTIHVTPRPPVMVVRSGGGEVPVAADGTLLSGDGNPHVAKLPSIAVDRLPPGGQLSGTPRGEALVLGAAPAPLAREVNEITSSDSHGITVKLQSGIQVRFGTPAAARAKWLAAAAVLADKRLTTLSYVDVQVPKRPAVG